MEIGLVDDNVLNYEHLLRRKTENFQKTKRTEKKKKKGQLTSLTNLVN
jgi:hypothetical protein